MSQNQRTIQREIVVKGVGLHTGRKCTATFKPAPADFGRRFLRSDLPHFPEFTAAVDSVIDVVRGTTLGSGEDRVYTIEHVLSALHGVGVDNVLIELDDNEPPIGDGSALIFVDALLAAGIEDQGKERPYFKVESPLAYESNQTVIRIEPGEGFQIDCEVDYNHPAIKHQKFVFDESTDYKTAIAPARTYCFDYEIEALKKRGLAKGGSLDNAIVIGPQGIYNPGRLLRFENEIVRHKILDLIGDLSLLGHPLKGRIVAKRCGHGHNINFLRKLIKQYPVAAAHSS